MAGPTAFWNQVYEAYDADTADFYVSFADHPGAALIIQLINQTITSGIAPDALQRGLLNLLIAQFHGSHACTNGFELQSISGAQGNAVVGAVSGQKSGSPDQPAVAENANVAGQSASTVNGRSPTETADPINGKESAEQTAPVNDNPAQRAAPANGVLQAQSASVTNNDVAARSPSANQGVVQRDCNQVQQATIEISDDDSESDADSDAGSVSTTVETHEQTNTPRHCKNGLSEKAAGKKRKIDNVDADAQGPATGSDSTSWSDQQGQRLTLLEQKVKKKKTKGGRSTKPKMNDTSEREESQDISDITQEVLKLLARKPEHLNPIVEEAQNYERSLKRVFYYDNLGDEMDLDGPVFAGDPAGVLPRPQDCKLQPTISMRNPTSALGMGLTIEGGVIDTVLKVIGPNTSRGLPMNDYRLVIQRSMSPETSEQVDIVYQHMADQASRRVNMSTEQRDLLARHEFNNELHLARDKEERPLREQVKRKLEEAGKQFGNP